MKLKLKENTITPKTLKLRKNLGNPLLVSMGNIGYADILRTFKTQGKNIGKSWAKLSKLTLLWRRKGKGGGSAKALLSAFAAAFGLHQKEIPSLNRVELRTNKMVGGVDIAAVHNEGIKPHAVSAKQRAWFHYKGIHLSKGKKLSIPQRKFMEISRSAKKEMEDLPREIVKKI